MTETTKRAALYREAASRIAERKNVWSCCAIERVTLGCGPTWGKETKAYREIFATSEDGEVSISAFDTAGGSPIRILALCFMAAMVEAGDA